MLLIDEPEICLHPNAVRDACRTLYDLPANSAWQVMVTTHSPVFIDLTRDNTKVVRVARNEMDDIVGTTIYRAAKSRFDENDRANLKLLNLCDPHVTEFFFGGRTVLVEGDTEYTAFCYVREKHPDEFRNVHIVRARGKATLVSLAKVLNHFGTGYAILHDSDTANVTSKKGNVRRNPAWALNESILTITQAADAPVTLVASVPNFEQAYFGEGITDEKPYNALRQLRDSPEFLRVAHKLLTYLATGVGQLPDGALAWSSINELEAAVAACARIDAR